jgi:V/A-type H+-transporting ATPase subunit E
MPESIESFVAKLQTEGVEAGKQAAEKVKADAQAEAEKVVADARQQAEKIQADAEAKAKETQERTKTELSLAARDTVLKLRDSLGRGLSGLLAEGVKENLEDEGLLRDVLREMILLYAKADAEQAGAVTVTVSDEMQGKLSDWAKSELAQALSGRNAKVDLKGGLAQAGFEYEVDGATVEVTLDAVVEVLSEMLSDPVREILQQGLAEKKG